MNRNKLWLSALAVLLCATTLVACAGGNGAGNESEKETQAQSATNTTRYDYLKEDVAQYVTIDKSAYTDMKLTISSAYKIKDSDVQDYIEYIRFENRTAVNGETEIKDIEVKMGDDAFIYYKGFVDGEAFDGGSNWDDEKPYQLGIGSQTFIPGFEEGLVGVIPNTTSKDKPFNLYVTFPEDYQNEALAGKDVVFHVVITHTVQYNLPTYNLEFITDTLEYEFKKEYYASDRARFTEFEAAVREELELSNKEALEGAKVDAMWTYLISKATFSMLPESEVNYYYENYVAELQSYYDYYSASSVNGEEFKKAYPVLDDFAVDYMGLAKDADWKAEMKRRAEDIVKRDMLGHAIAEIEGIETVSDEEYKAEIQYWMDQYSDYGMTAEDVEASMGVSGLKEMAFSAKIEKWLLGRATFTFEGESAEDGAESEVESEIETKIETEPEDESESDGE